MIGKFIFVLIILASQTFLFAQETSFTVLAVNGKISLSSLNSKTSNNLFTGTKILHGNKINLGNSSYLGLLYSEGGTIELKTPGVYDFNMLSSRLKNINKSANQKFIQFVCTEFAKKIYNKRNMKLYGEVVRVRDNYIASALPNSFSVIDSIVNFGWYPISGSPHFIFKLMNTSNKTIFMKELSDTLITLNLNSFYLENDSVYKWIVYSYDNPRQSSDTNFFSKLSPVKAESIKDSLYQLSKTIGEDNNALNAILYAEMYCRNNLNLEACAEYKKAFEFEPSVETYKNLYHNFLILMKLDKMVQSDFNNPE